MSQIFCFLANVYCLVAALCGVPIACQLAHHHPQTEPRPGPASSVPGPIINKRIIPKIRPKPTKTKKVLPQSSDLCTLWYLIPPL